MKSQHLVSGTRTAAAVSNDCVTSGPSCESVDPYYKRLYADAARRRADLCERFFAKVSAFNLVDCWHWNACTLRGYGKFGISGKAFQAHRVAYAICRSEPLLASLEIDHRCDNRSCVNPLHLDQVSQAENKSRGAQRRYISRTHCKSGHALDADNTVEFPGGYKQCRTCKRAADAARQRKQTRKKQSVRAANAATNSAAAISAHASTRPRAQQQQTEAK
jgi:hypothetical protein